MLIPSSTAAGCRVRAGGSASKAVVTINANTAAAAVPLRCMGSDHRSAGGSSANCSRLSAD
jgi:hypothetical protein